MDNNVKYFDICELKEDGEQDGEVILELQDVIHYIFTEEIIKNLSRGCEVIMCNIGEHLMDYIA